MKKFIIFLVAFVASLTAVAQDVIVKNDNSTILCRIVEVNNNEVVYLKWSDLDGPRYVMDRSLIANINYQDGRQDKLNPQTSNAYAPGNQQSGSALYNDKALLTMDLTRSNSGYVDYKSKAKKLKTVGLSVGSVLIAGGIGLLIAGANSPSDNNAVVYGEYIGGGVALAGGIGTLTYCLIKANQLQNVAQLLTVAPVLQQEFNIGKGKSLCAGIDVICDRQYKQTSLGLGLQYHF